MDRLSWFRRFSPITDEDYQLLTGNLLDKSFKKNAPMVVPGQVQRELYFINSGVQMSYFESGDKLHVIAFTYPPDLCAIPQSFSFQQPSPYHLTCLADSEVAVLTFDSLQALFQRSRAIETLFRRMTEAVLSGVINRHVELHAMTIEQRFKAFAQRSPHLLQLVPHKYLASYLSIDPTNFSKLFNSVKI